MPNNACLQFPEVLRLLHIESAEMVESIEYGIGGENRRWEEARGEGREGGEGEVGGYVPQHNKRQVTNQTKCPPQHRGARRWMREVEKVTQIKVHHMCGSVCNAHKTQSQMPQRKGRRERCMSRRRGCECIIMSPRKNKNKNKTPGKEAGVVVREGE